MRAAIALLLTGACVSPSFEEGYACPMGVCPPGQMCGDDGICRRTSGPKPDGASTIDSAGPLDTLVIDGVIGTPDGPLPDGPGTPGTIDALGCLDGGVPTGCTSPVRFTCGAPPGGCYVWCQNAVTWADANTACGTWAGGGHLAILGSSSDNDCVFAQIDAADQAVWIGLRQIVTLPAAPTDGWTWMPNNSSYFGEWDTGEPMDADGNEDGQEDCGRLSLNSTWHDIVCGENVQYICER